MSFNYTASSSPSDKNKVRLLIGDTEEDGHFLEDEEINFFIDQEASIFEAAARSAEAIAASLSQKADSATAEEVSAEFRNQAQRYYNLADRLEDRENKQGSGLKGLGTGNTLWGQDTDKIFSIGKFDNNDSL